MLCFFQQEYTHLDLFHNRGCSERYPRDKSVEPINKDLDMAGRSTLRNYTKAKGKANKEDKYSGTLSAATLQCIMEYTTKPGGIVFTLNAQFGAVYNAAENCGRLVYGGESMEHFGGESTMRIRQLCNHPLHSPGITEVRQSEKAESVESDKEDDGK